THFIAPGASSDAFVTGTNPFSIPRLSRGTPASPGDPESWGVWGAISGPPISSIQSEPEHLRGVLRGDLADDVLRRPAKDAREELARLRPGRFGVREVAAPQHVVDADRVAELDAEVVLHELHEHVAAPVVARHEPVLRPPSFREHGPLQIREVHLLQPVR